MKATNSPALDEGYIKFHLDWIQQPLPIPVPEELITWRNQLHQLKQIGYYPQLNIGYGNISLKTERGMLISGTQTGQIYPIQAQHFTLVTEANIQKNWVRCQGEIKASSESMTHQAVYDADPEIQAIIHVHNFQLWQRLIDQVPTTEPEVPYGTPAMAEEIQRLFQETSVKADRIIVMAGHEEGIITFGETLATAGQTLLQFLH